MAASVDDIASLCSNVIDIFLCRPDTNARLSFIQVDDVIELGLKTWLYLNVPGWTAVDHVHPTTGKEYFKGFPTVVSEVTGNSSAPASAGPLLIRATTRRNQRNSFFHDHRQAGLTIEPRRCIEAIIDMLDLFEAIFPDFKGRLCRYTTEQSQYKLIRLKGHALNDSGVHELLRRHFKSASRKHPPGTNIGLRGNRVITFGCDAPAYEWLASHQDGSGVAAACDEVASKVGITL